MDFQNSTVAAECVGGGKSTCDRSGQGEKKKKKWTGALLVSRGGSAGGGSEIISDVELLDLPVGWIHVGGV